jgi:hypothetical protein
MVGKCLLIKEEEACDRIQFAHTSAVVAWTPIWSDAFGVLIPMVSADANVTVEYYVGGRFKFTIASGVTVLKGDLLYYTIATTDVTNVAPSAVSGTTAFPLGRATEAGSAVAGYVTVELFEVNCNIVIYKTATVASEVSRIWATTPATSGTLRSLSVRAFFTGAGTADGEALRVYTQTNVSVANIHGIHATAQLGAEGAASVGAVTGQAAGVRATIGIGLTNTAGTGTIAALRCDSYFLSTGANAASSFIYMTDVGTSYGVDAIIRLGAIVGRTTSKTTMTAPYAYVVGKMTMGSASIALKIVTPDGAFYIPGLLAADYS